jgi:poly(3-hydroxybutyrate) depolymerase
MMSAFHAMNKGAAAKRPRKARASRVPVIVFHGDCDHTVHPSNADSVLAADGQKTVETRGRSAGGAAYSRTVYLGAEGKSAMESWTIHGAGHAWAGGASEGSFTDPKGPDASAEMIRFFFEHPKS